MTDATITRIEATGALRVAHNGRTVVICPQPGHTPEDQEQVAREWIEGKGE